MYILKETTYAGTTDVNGYFSISKFLPVITSLLFLSVGFDTLETAVTLKADEIITKKLFLDKKTVMLQEVEVSAEGRRKIFSAMGVTKITPREIKQVPAVGGEPDLAQYLQVLPGVISQATRAAVVHQRGTPIQNKVLLDGMVIYNPFHSIGLLSVFDTDIIRSADVYSGGFGAEYGEGFHL
jgi:hypothetical protein